MGLQIRQELSSLGPILAFRRPKPDRLLGRNVFEDKTFADMARGSLPLVMINASDFNNGSTFSLIQPQFDFLCSSLTSYPVAHAVVASAAVPVALAPIALRNYPDCPQRYVAWVDKALGHDNPLDRCYALARALGRYRHAERMPLV